MHAKIVLATQNQGKLKELQPLLSSLDIELIAQSNFNMPAHEETALTFIENAISKARWAAQHTQLPAIGDDSGLVVHSLHGAPGLYSSRYAHEQASDNENIDKLLGALQGNSDRRAYFYCAMAYLNAYDDPSPIVGIGHFFGDILTERQGNSGFGYDPVFYLPEFSKTAAELSPNQKNKISHRAKATDSLVKQLRMISS